MHKKSTKSNAMRTIAEAQLVRNPPTNISATIPVDSLEHELHVHQIELEMQNEELRRTHLELAASHDRYVDLYDFAPVGYLTLADNGMVVEANLTGASLLGVERNKLLRCRFARFVTAEDVMPWNRFLSDLRRGGRQSCDLTLQRLDRSVFLAHLSGMYSEARNNSPAMVRITLADISERKQSEALRLSESRFRGAFETAAHGMALVSPEGRWLKVNQSLCTILGYGEEELLATDFQTITHPDDLSVGLACLRQLLAGTISNFQSKKRYFHKDGHVVWVLLSVAMVRDGDGQPIHFVTQIQDISVQKIAEMELLAAKNQLELQVNCINRIQNLFIGESQPDMLFEALLLEILELTASTHGFIAEVMRDEQEVASLRVLAISCDVGDEAAKSCSNNNILADSRFSRIHDFHNDPILNGQPVIINVPPQDSHWGVLFDGCSTPQTFLGVPIKQGEEIVGVLGMANRPQGYDLSLVNYLGPVVSASARIIEGYRIRRRKSEVETSLREANTLLKHEIKEREQIQAELQQERDNLREITATLAEGLYVVDLAGRVTFINPTALTILGWREEEVLGQSSHALFHHTLVDGSPHPPDNCLLYEVLHQGRVVTTDEEWLWRRDGRGFPVVVSASPIYRTGKVHGAVLAFRDITERKQIEDALRKEQDFIREMINALPGVFCLISQEGRFKLWNKKFEENTGYTPEEIMIASPADFFQGEDVATITESVQEVFTQGAAAAEANLVAKDGTITPHYFVGQRIERDGMSYLIGMGLDISERRRMEDALREAKKQAEVATTAKSNFLSSMSHEIRTPMNGLLGMTDLLLGTPMTDQQRHYTETIHRSGRTLLRIINDILDLSKIQAGQLVLELLRFDLDEVVHDIIDMFAGRVKSKGLAIHCKMLDGVSIHLLGDPYRLSQILFNLMGNAIKFTEAGSIGLTVEVTEEREVDILLRFQVTDTGIGIAPTYQQQMFQPFSQEDSSISRKFGGTGLGLAITQRLVTMMDGDLGVESAPGQGSTFWFTARFGKQQEGDRQEIAAWQVVQRSPTPDNIRFKGRVLLVEDNQVNQEVAIATLELFGCQVTVACNGQRAMPLVREADTPFDAIFMDCEMPILDGFETTRRLRQWESDTGRPRTPIIALTAHVLEQSRQQCKEAGMDDYLRKPFSQADLGAILYRWLPRENNDTVKQGQTVVLSSDPDQDTVDSPPVSPAGDHTGGMATLPSAPVLDLVVLDHILKLDQDGNKGLLSKMVEIYLTRTPVLLAELEQAMDRHDNEAVRVAAHTLKSSSLTMGVVRLAEMGQAMETDYTNLVQARRYFQQSGSSFAGAKQALSDLCAAQQTGDYHE
ncbi:MAG: PAS domain S-box protein [Magnetococcales bacterium]|nr:PAS domain S-box protein [Magnetococcales bacterium]